ncbi:hypothetical protein EDM56_01275 [Brevibacillus fluminis]|uniref:Uncharacterized protein n=1 Tax=Brevibacillus fluminis TaxID=511487 RepID=A0A3M8DZE8_9BACL|nr:hypothetical protein [Brevibacillus fluminis]RNB92357.1 hypothetical protein EDM56_01275 [Brevibacillus fluminis]
MEESNHSFDLRGKEKNQLQWAGFFFVFVLVEARGFLKESSTEVVTMPTGGRGKRPKEKIGNCAPKHTLRGGCISSMYVWRKSVSDFFAVPGWHCQCFCSAFFQKSRSCTGKLRYSLS